MKKLPYWRRWINTAFGGAWTSYNTTRAVTAIFVPLVLTPFAKWYYPPLEPYMPDLLWQIPPAVLVLFFAGRIFLTPGWLDQEREQEIENLKQQLYDRANRQAQCDTIVDLIDEGKRVQRFYATQGSTPTIDKAGAWLAEVSDYLRENFGRASVSQWENEDGLSLPESSQDKLRAARILRADQMVLPAFFFESERAKINKTLSFRLIRLRELLARLQNRLLD
jgi:hypothetical protein